jgi:uncharacterized membrane protein
MRTVIAYLVTLAVFLAVDVVWLTTVAVPQFQAKLGSMLKPEPDLYAAAAFYLIYAAGLVYLAVRPALVQASAWTAASHGAMVGLTAYATFDLTSLAVVKGWTVGLAVLDMAWGTALSGASAVVGYLAAARFSRS